MRNSFLEILKESFDKEGLYYIWLPLIVGILLYFGGKYVKNDVVNGFGKLIFLYLGLFVIYAVLIYCCFPLFL